jgi:hypothetical protein
VLFLLVFSTGIVSTIVQPFFDLVYDFVVQ